MNSFNNYFILLIIIVIGSNSCSDNIKDQDKNVIIIENAEFRLSIGKDARVMSLLHKPTGQECLQKGIHSPLCSLTQYRPYENELQLKFPAAQDRIAS